MTTFSKFVNQSAFFKSFANIWKLMPKSKITLVGFSRLFLVLSMMDYTKFEGFFTLEMKNVLLEVLVTKNELACTDLLFGVGNFASNQNISFFFTNEEFFECLLGFLYFQE